MTEKDLIRSIVYFENGGMKFKEQLEFELRQQDFIERYELLLTSMTSLKGFRDGGIL